MLGRAARQNSPHLPHSPRLGIDERPAALRSLHPMPTAVSTDSVSHGSTSGIRRVVHVALGTHVGGMERLLVEFARRTDRQHFTVEFVSLESCGPIATELEAAGCSVTSFGKTPGLKPWLVFRLARHLRSSRAQVLHTHNTAGFIYGVLAAKMAGIPKIIHTRHGQRFLASKRETSVFQRLSRFADHIVSVSHDSQQLTIAEGVAATRCSVIPNGINVDHFSFAGPQPDGPAILVARLSPEKDVATLIRAFSYLPMFLAGKADSFSLQIVGDGSERASLEQLARTLNCTNRIHFLGQQHDIESRLGQASMFVLPSLSEGISLTLLEAMARGLPVIATRVGGTPEVIQDGVSGLLVPVGDAMSMANAIAEVVLDPKRGQQMGQKGRERVEQSFDVRGMIRAYENLYLLDSRREAVA